MQRKKPGWQWAGRMSQSPRHGDSQVHTCPMPCRYGANRLPHSSHQPPSPSLQTSTLRVTRTPTNPPNYFSRSHVTTGGLISCSTSRRTE